MGVREKYVLYNLLYFEAANRVLSARGRTKMILPWHIHKAVMERINYILAAIGEKFTDEEFIECGFHEVSIEDFKEEA